MQYIPPQAEKIFLEKIRPPGAEKNIMREAQKNFF